MTSVPGFLTKTFEIFSSPEYSDCCGWGSNGETIIIRKIEQFSKQVLPKYFKHSNFQSFVRQLNMYDFHKTIQDPHHGEFVHEYFRQNKPELLINIKRKANKPPEAGAAKAGKNPKQAGAVGAGKNSAGAGGGGAGSGGVGGSNSGGKNTNTAPLKATPINTNVNINSNMNNNNMLTTMQLNHNSLSLSNSLHNNNNTTNNNTNNTINTHYTPLLLQDTSNINNMNLNIDDLGSEMTDGLPYYVDEDNTYNNNTYNNNYTYDNYMSTLPEEIATETGGLMQELHQQRTLREQFERRMESKLAALQGENNMLKSMFMESHRKNAIMQERMERVMKTLYTMFVGVNGVNGVGNGSGSPGMALTNKAPSMLLTDMQHFLQQQKSTSSSEIALLKEMEVDTHSHSPPHTTSYGTSSSSGSGGSGVDSVGGVGGYSGSGLRGGLGRPIVLGNGSSSNGGNTSGGSGMEVLGYDETEHLGGNSNNVIINDSAEDEEARLLRLDSATLGRLPSLDLDELASLPTDYTTNNNTTNNTTNNTNTNNSNTNTNYTTNTTTSNTNTNYTTNTTTNTTNNTNNTTSADDYYHHLLHRPLAGAALGDVMKVTSFDIAASAVTAPSLQQQSSFDSAYLPVPSRVFLQPGSSQLTGVQPLGCPATDGRPPLPRTATNSNTSTSIGGGVGVGGGIGSGIGGSIGSGIGSGAGAPLLSRQRTFDYTSINPNPSLTNPSSSSGGGLLHRLGSVDSAGSGGSGSSGSSGVYDVNGKRKVDAVVPGANTLGTNFSTSGTSGGMDGSDVISPAKKLKGAWTQSGDGSAQDEASALENEDVHSSLNEAQQFMHLLHRNQETTLTRLDSLEQTIACLFDGSDAPSIAPSIAPTTASFGATSTTPSAPSVACTVASSTAHSVASSAVPTVAPTVFSSAVPSVPSVPSSVPSSTTTAADATTTAGVLEQVQGQGHVQERVVKEEKGARGGK